MSSLGHLLGGYLAATCITTAVGCMLFALTALRYWARAVRLRRAADKDREAMATELAEAEARAERLLRSPGLINDMRPLLSGDWDPDEIIRGGSDAS